MPSSEVDTVYGFLVWALLFGFAGGCMAAARVVDGLNGTCKRTQTTLRIAVAHSEGWTTYRCPLVVHSAALHAHYERKEVLVRHGGTNVRGGSTARRHARSSIRGLSVHGDAGPRQLGALVLQARALSEH